MFSLWDPESSRVWPTADIHRINSCRGSFSRNSRAWNGDLMDPSRDLDAERVDDSKIAQLLNLAVSVVVVGALYFAREILIPITLAVLLAFVLAPLVQLLRRLKVPRAPAVLLAAALSLAVLLGLGGVI